MGVWGAFLEGRLGVFRKKSWWSNLAVLGFGGNFGEGRCWANGRCGVEL